MVFQLAAFVIQAQFMANGLFKLAITLCASTIKTGLKKRQCRRWQTLKTQEIKWRKTATGDWQSVCGRFRIEPMYWGNASPSEYKLYIDGKVWFSYGRLGGAKGAANEKVNVSEQELEKTKQLSEGLKKSNAERQAAFRARKVAKKLQEVRGIFATEENALKIRQFAESLKT